MLPHAMLGERAYAGGAKSVEAINANAQNRTHEVLARGLHFRGRQLVLSLQPLSEAVEIDVDVGEVLD